jgi:inhibitor of KinA
MMEIFPLGDSALVIRLREQFEDAPEKTLGEVLRAFRRLCKAAIPGVVELAPAYTTVAVFYDLARIAEADIKPNEAFDRLAELIRKALSDTHKTRRRKIEVRTIEIPVCYDTEFGFDLPDVAHHTGLSTQAVVDLHCSSQYWVSCVGFTPGFPFLSGMPKKLATPRRAMPRKEIPAGSVAIGGAQTGVYPIKSPGGWNVIGRTPLHLFDPQKNPPTLLRAGDRVWFRAITRDGFEKSLR